MLLYHWLLIPKFIGVMLFAAGFGAAFLSNDSSARKRAVHQIASPGLLLVWVFGFAALGSAQMSMGEKWIVGSLALSFLTQSVLVVSLRSPPKLGTFLAAAIPLCLTLFLMVGKPR